MIAGTVLAPTTRPARGGHLNDEAVAAVGSRPLEGETEERRVVDVRLVCRCQIPRLACRGCLRWLLAVSVPGDNTLRDGTDTA